MKISTKGRYAIRMMLDVAQHQGDGYVSLKDIASRQDISKKYLEQIVPILNRGNFLITTRGYQGGYRLARNPSEYTVKEILELTEGGLAPVACLEAGAPVCDRSASCATLPMWQGLMQVVSDYLEGITLQKLLDKQQEFYENSYVI
jgi:Rrf2 family protein